MLLDVLVLAGFYFAIFGVLGVNLFGFGILTRRCAAPDFTHAYSTEEGDGLMVVQVSWHVAFGQPYCFLMHATPFHVG